MGRPLDPESKHWKRMRAKIIKRDGCCFVCKGRSYLTVHHIKPRRHGGKTTERNLITMCDSCHNRAEYYDMDWPAIINFEKQKRLGFKDDFEASDEMKKVGKDKFGIFIIRGVPQDTPVIYNGLWPTPVLKVKDRMPVYQLLPVGYAP